MEWKVNPQTRKEDIKLSLFPNGMIVYVENPRESTKTPELISDYSKVIGAGHFPVYQQYKIRIWNLKHCLIYVSTPEMKNLGTRSVYYRKTIKLCRKKIKEQQNKCIDHSCSWIEKLSSKLSVLSAWSIDLIKASQYLHNLFCEFQLTEFLCRGKRPGIANTTLKNSQRTNITQLQYLL